MSTADSMHHPGILVLRPTAQAKGTLDRIHQEGWNPIHFPTIDIVPLMNSVNADIIRHLDKYDWLIFISRNAVVNFQQQLPGNQTINAKVAAVGQGTAKALAKHGIQTDLQPTKQFDSEHLLASKSLQHVQGQNILIIRGKGGRELLANTLSSRGANIEYLEVYERKLPSTDASTLVTTWQQQVNLVLATSNQLLDNLVTLVKQDGQQNLINTPLVVISNRMHEHATQLGFKKIGLAGGASDDQMVEAIRKTLTLI